MTSWPFVISQVMLWLLMLLLSATVLAMVRQIGLIHRRIPPVGARVAHPGPAVGDEAPDFDHIDLSGRRLSLGRARGRRTLLVFMSSRCSACRDVAPSIRSIARSERSTTDTIMVSDGTPETVREFIREFRLEHIPIIVSPMLTEQYRVLTTPFGVLIDESGRVQAKGIVNGIEHLESLIYAGDLGASRDSARGEGQSELNEMPAVVATKS